MLHRFVLLPFLALLSACNKPAAEFPAVVRSSVVLMRPGLGAVCGGVAIGERTILTAAHCVDDVHRVAYVDLGSWSKYARRFQWANVIVRDPGTDVALLRPDLPLEEWAIIRPPVDYEELRVVIDFEVKRPELSYVSDLKMGIYKGDSGSGVFGKDGAAVGIVVTCQTTDGNHCDGLRGRYSPVRSEWLTP